ncbi:MAG: class I SAM-dependent methyltransferase, partial [Candidatus Pelagibacter sp.]
MIKLDKKFGKVNYCHVCNSKKLYSVIKIGSTGLCDSLLTESQIKKKNEKSYPLNLYRCKKCQLLQLDYIVNNKKVFHLNYPYKSGITKRLKELLYANSEYLKKNFNFSKKPLAIDIGSNDGTLLEGFKKKNFEVLGVEPTNIANLANKRGIKTIKKFFDLKTAKLIKKKFKKAEVISGT